MTRQKSQQSEARLRERIRQTLRGTGIKLTPALAQKLEDEFIKLFHKFSTAPESTKDRVYSAGERKIIRTLRATVRASR